MSRILYTIGHSNHEQDHFCQLLLQHQIEVLVDVRSQPYSQYNPQFSTDPLRAALSETGIRYEFMGDQLGGRPSREDFYDEAGHVLYYLVAEADYFQAGIDHLLTLAETGRTAIMCSEEDPAVCHRFLLVTRVLDERGVEIRHIRGDGSLASEADVRARSKDNRDQGMLFAEMENDTWKSLRSVLPKAQPPSSLGD